MRPGASAGRRFAAAAGALAAVAGAAVGTAALLRTERPGPAIREVDKITATAARFPLSEAELSDLLNRPAELGPLTDPGRRASCLTGLGYPAGGPVLGATTLRLGGTDAVVLVLAGERPDMLAALAVPGGCNAADTGLLADTTLRRP